MTVHQIPVLIHQVAPQWFVARGIDGPQVAASATTRSQAVEQVTRYLKAVARHPSDQTWPTAKTYQLNRQTVTVRLYYRDGHRRFPVSRQLSLRIQYVLGHYSDGSLECIVPATNDYFHCPEKSELESLINESVRTTTSAMTPRQVLGLVPHSSSELITVRVRVDDALFEKSAWDLEPLETVAEPLGVRSRRGDRQTAWFREPQVGELVRRLQQPGNTLLLGEAGCGKSTILHAAALEFHNHEKHSPDNERHAPPPSRIWSTSAGNLIAGMQYLGEWEQRLEEIIQLLAEFRGILVVDSLSELMRLGGREPSGSLAAFLLPYLVRGELKMVAEATPEQLAACRRVMPGFAEAFRIQKIDTLTTQVVRQVADRMLTDAQRSFGLQIDPATAEVTTRLFARFLPYQTPPRGMVHLLREWIGEHRRKPDSTVLTPQLVIDKFSRQTGLPARIVSDAVQLTADDVAARLATSVVGQDEAVQAAVDCVLRLKTGLCDPARPIATLFFCGPTGVGKTQLARSLADYLLEGRSDGGRLIRLDMSEYAGYDAVDRLLMASDGEPAKWIQRLRTWPLGVVLLDEFEKASPEVFDCLLTALDEGRISDRFGRTTTLCGTVIIMTSNVGARSTRPLGFTGDGHDRSNYRRALHHTFRPEFLNRLDQVVYFQALSVDTIRTIVEHELTSLTQREAIRTSGVELSWNDTVVERLAQIGFDPALGARPLQRAIESKLVAPLARKLITHPDTHHVDLAELLAVSG